MTIPELLAPVGSREALVAAVQNGADAVYLGGKLFSARQYADNFDREELCDAIEYAHVRDVRVYVTVNTLLADSEFAEAASYLKFLYEAGADAVIVQDLGVARIVSEVLPHLALHASTQMTVHNSAGVTALKEHGFSRVVLARELSLREISEIREKSGVELEVFVHGALCVCYSGQCLMSSMIGGRSGNRGRCAQPCRMEYSLVDEQGTQLVDPEHVGRHLLSPMDLNMIRHIPELAGAGVASLKIEGRMKRPEYVAIVTGIYRSALDRYRQSPDDYTVDERELKDLAQIFNRGFTTGYFFGKPGKDMMSYKRPNNRGLRLGRVSRTDRAGGSVELDLEDDLRLGDGIEFWVTEGGRRGVVVNHILVNGRQVESVAAGQKAWVTAEGKIRPGDRVFKTHDVQLISHAEQSYSSARETKKIPLDFVVTAHVGQPFEMQAADGLGNRFAVKSDFMGIEALNKPLNEESLYKQLDRLGNTPFAVGRLKSDIGQNVMIPASVINETRRKAVEGLAAIRAEVQSPRLHVDPDFEQKVRNILRDVKPSGLHPRSEAVMLTARVYSLSIVRAVAENGADIVYFGGSNLINQAAAAKDIQLAMEICGRNGVRLVIATPRIIREFEMKNTLNLLEIAGEYGLPLLTGNLGIIEKAVEMDITDIYGDFPLNIYNSQSLAWLEEKYHIKQATLSPELTMDQIAGIGNRAGILLEALAEGHLPLMVTEYCPQGGLLGGLATGSKCKRPCKSKSIVGLKDRMGLVFPVTQDEFCRAYIYNTKELSMIEDIPSLAAAGISRLRIETSIEDADRAGRVTKLWRAELDRFSRDPAGFLPRPEVKEKISAMTPAGLTKGHYYRGVE